MDINVVFCMHVCAYMSLWEHIVCVCVCVRVRVRVRVCA